MAILSSIVIFSIFPIITFVNTQDNRCPRPNQVYTECVNQCPYACPGIKVNCISIKCFPGCDCKAGFVWNIHMDCVRPNMCNRNCGPFEKYSRCVNPCPALCPGVLRSRPCHITPCKPGCNCIDGYYRDNTNRCVQLQNCPNQCFGPHEVFSSCVNTCPEVCPGLPRPCTRPPCRPGCNCEEGYVRNKFKKCVKPSDC